LINLFGCADALAVARFSFVAHESDAIPSKRLSGQTLKWPDHRDLSSDRALVGHGPTESGIVVTDHRSVVAEVLALS